MEFRLDLGRQIVSSVRVLFCVALLNLAAGGVGAQQPAPAGQAPVTETSKPADNSSQAAAPVTPQKPETKGEVSIQDSGTTFRLHVNLVQVHVVIRDARGKPIPDLHQEDFLLYDQGKLQQISTFAVETRESRMEKAAAAAKTQVADEQSGASLAAALPDRFIALLFDDTHMTMEDTVNVRVQVMKFLDGVAPTDRIAIYSSSGQMTHDFTSDKAALKQTLMGLIPRPRYATSGASECPSISHYEADQIENFQNPQVLQVVALDTVQCLFGGDMTKMPQALSIVQSTAPSVLQRGDSEALFVYQFMGDVLGHLAGMPGERVMILASPGFLLTTQHLDMVNVVDRANHANIVINTLDARGLYTPDMGDISQPSATYGLTAGPRSTYRLDAQSADSYVLRDLAYGTGGVAFQNSNDLADGFHQLGAAPEISYVLGFSPQNEKWDGRYHTLKVTMAQKHSKNVIQARHGYFAPRHLDDPAQQERADIQEAVFSRDEILDLPLQLQTQYFKTDATGARLSVVSRLDLKGIHFRKADGRNLDNLVVATVIFDDNGNFVTGGEKIVTMKLLDGTYEKLLRAGLTVKSSFDVKPGRYMVRQVVRDSEGAQMAARNGAVEIPF